MAKAIEILEAENTALANKNAALIVQNTKLLAIIGEDYTPCEGCGHPTYAELLAERKAYRNGTLGQKATVFSAIDTPLAGYKYAADTPLSTDAFGQIVSKQAISDLAKGKKVKEETLDKRVEMSAYLTNPNAVAALVEFWVQTEILVEDSEDTEQVEPAV